MARPLAPPPMTCNAADAPRWDVRRTWVCFVAPPPPCYNSPYFDPILCSHPAETAMQRFGSVIQVRPEKLDEYKTLHAEPWPQVLATISACNIRNYSIYYHDGYLFSHFEYVGDDFAADMQKMAADPVTQEWWTLTNPCQVPLPTRQPGEWWARMEEVFYHP